MSWRWRTQRKIAKVQEEIQKLEQKSPMMTPSGPKPCGFVPFNVGLLPLHTIKHLERI